MYKLVHQRLTLTTSVASTFDLPEGSKEHLFVLESSAIGYRWGTSTTNIATEGVPMQAGQTLSLIGPVKKCPIAFYQASGGSVVLHWTYLQPVLR